MMYAWRWFDGGFPSALDAEFRRATAGLQPHEIPLFGALQLAFESLTHDFLIDVLHGAASQVTFSASAPWSPVSGTAQCELCDLLIVSFRAKPFVARLTCLQNKADPRIGGVPRRFAADMVQLELLHHRRDICGLGKFKPPSNLLSGALLTSVASYGVFYRDTLHDYSMAYRVASELTPPTTAKGKKRKVGDLLGPSCVRSVEGHSEVIGAPSTFQFASHLASFRIGTPLHGRSGKGEPPGYRSEVRQWLGGVLSARLATLTSDSSGNPSAGAAAAALLAQLDGAGDQAVVGDNDGPPIIVLQTDGRAVPRA